MGYNTVNREIASFKIRSYSSVSLRDKELFSELVYYFYNLEGALFGSIHAWRLYLMLLGGGWK